MGAQEHWDLRDRVNRDVKLDLVKLREITLEVRGIPPPGPSARFATCPFDAPYRVTKWRFPLLTWRFLPLTWRFPLLTWRAQLKQRIQDCGRDHPEPKITPRAQV